MEKHLLRTAIVGCGRVARTAHFSAVKGCPELELVAVCDVDEQRAHEAARANNAKAYRDLETMLAEETLDLVTIAVPNGLHARLAMKVARRGVDILCEKPLSMRLDEADELIDLCEAGGVRLFTILQNRFNRTNQLLKRAVDKGRFGRLLSCNVTLRWHRPLSYYTEDRQWRSRRDLAGGVFTNQAVHYVDAMQWLVGAPPEMAFAKMATCLRPVDVETHGSAIVSFRNGVIGSFDLTCLSHGGDREGSITLMGEKGTVKLGGKSMNRVLEWDFADPDPDDDAAIEAADYEPPTVYGFGHEEMYRRVSRLLIAGEGELDVPDGREGRKSVAILSALYESDRSGQPVRFPLGHR